MDMTFSAPGADQNIPDCLSRFAPVLHSFEKLFTQAATLHAVDFGHLLKYFVSAADDV